MSVDNSVVPPTCVGLSSNSTTSISNSVMSLSGGSETLAVLFQNSVVSCSLEVGLICNLSLQTPILGTYTKSNTCDYKTTFEGSLACPVFTISEIWKFLNKFSYLFGAFFIVSGFLLGLFGRKLWVAAIFFITFFIVSAGILLLFYTTFLKSTTDIWVGWTVLAGAIVIGIVLGLLITKFQKLGGAIIAAFGGFVLGLILNEAVLYLASRYYVFWCVCVGCAIIAAALVFIAYNHVIILSTSLVGSYFLVRGISLYAGSFPEELTLTKQIKAGTILHEPLSFYIYLVGIVIATIICAILQYMQLAKMNQ